MAFSSPDQQRAIFSLSFEPAEEGFIYYRSAWSRGIPVTAEEREAYLNIPALGSRQAWRASLAGRQTLAPRPYWTTLQKNLAELPLHMALLAILFGLMTLLSGLSESSWFIQLSYVIGGLALITFGLGILMSRLVTGRSNAS